MKNFVLRVSVVAAVSAVAVAATVPAAQASGPPRFARCADLQARYPHGVAEPGAHDAVRGSTAPVTTFVVNRKVYLANQRLDRDRDGVACEKR